eukprot:RCo028436
MSKLDKFFKAKDSKKEKELQKSVPKPTAEDAEELQKIVQGEFVVASEIGGKTLTLTKEGVAIEQQHSLSSTAPKPVQWPVEEKRAVSPTTAPPPEPPPKEEKKPETWRPGASRSRKPEVKMQPEDFPSLADAAKVKDKEIREKAEKAAAEAKKEAAPSGNLFRAPSGPPRSALATSSATSMFTSRQGGDRGESGAAFSSTSWR